MGLGKSRLPALLGVLLTGCAAPTDPMAPAGAGTYAGSTPAFRPGQPQATRRYALRATAEAAFKVAPNVLDGNFHSAWGPASADAAPTLTLSLDEEVDLSGIAVKLGGEGTLFDVAVADDDGFHTIAAGLAPTSGQVTHLELPSADARQVRLTFHGPNVSHLLVCDVEVFATGTEVPSPDACGDLAPQGRSVT